MCIRVAGSYALDVPLTQPARPAHLEVTFGPSAELIGIVRRFVADLYGHALGDAETVSRITLATHELLENAVRNTTDQGTSIRIRVDTAPDGTATVVVQTWNRASPENIAKAVALIEEAANTDDPFALYQRLMRETAKRTDGSGLGLVRVRVESDFSLSHRVEGDTLHVVATWTSPTRSPA